MNSQDFFQRLGLPRRFAVDAYVLEREYLSRSRAVHPDYHLGGSAADLAASLESSAALNEAYNALRTPFSRAEHLLALLGGPPAAEHKAMPAAFLAEMLEARETVEQVRASPSNQAAILELDQQFQVQQNRLLESVARNFEALEQMPPDDSARTKLLLEVRGLLNAVKFVQGLLRDLHDE